MAFPLQPMPAKDKTGKSQGDAECCICTNWKLRTLNSFPFFRREKNFAERLRKGWRLKIPGSDHFDEVDVGGADDDGRPDGAHAQPVVDTRIAEVDHQVIVPLHHPHREARLKSNPSNSETSRQIMTSASFTTLQIQSVIIRKHCLD